MSDASQGPGWWQASDGKWYPPEQAPGAAVPTPPPTAPPGYGPAPTVPPAYTAPAAFGAPAPGAPGQLAEWPQRVLSGLIDYIAPAIVAGILIQVSFALGAIVELLALGWGIYNAYLNGTTGQSVGKAIIGTKVVSEETGQVIGGGNGILRWLFHIVDGIICGIGYLFPLWDPKKQTIADKLAHTVVITGAPTKSFGEALKSS